MLVLVYIPGKLGLARLPRMALGVRRPRAARRAPPRAPAAAAPRRAQRPPVPHDPACVSYIPHSFIVPHACDHPSEALPRNERGEIS